MNGHAVIPSVVTVRNGAVTAVNEGNATVYAVCGDNVMQCEINVISNSSYLAGDANLDGKVSLSDAVRILQYVANNNKYPLLSAQAAKNADVYGNNDGVTANAMPLPFRDMMQALPLTPARTIIRISLTLYRK